MAFSVRHAGAFYPLIYYFTFPTPRYRHAIDPQLVILAVFLISQCRLISAEMPPRHHCRGAPQLERGPGAPLFARDAVAMARCLIVGSPVQQ